MKVIVGERSHDDAAIALKDDPMFVGSCLGQEEERPPAENNTFERMKMCPPSPDLIGVTI